MNREKRKRRGRKLLKWMGISMAVLLVLPVAAVGIARITTYVQSRIHTASGIDEGIFVDLCGQEQYLLIRGKNTENPVMLWLHGGPAGPDAFANYAFQKHLVDDYTVVNWDQRGCGRTYYRNIKADPQNETATFAQAEADLDALVRYLTARFGTEKIILVGHSYGTLLGCRYALSHPDKVAAFIGVGQFVNIESDIYSYEHALAAAKAKGDDTGPMEEAFAVLSQDMTLPNLMALRGHVGKYHTAEKERNSLWLGVASPYMGVDDLRWFLRQIGDLEGFFALNGNLFRCILEEDLREYSLCYQVPVGFISGSDDWVTPVRYAADYCDSITAPAKSFSLLEGCGHAPQYDDPEAFCRTLEAMLAELLA